MIDCDEIHVCNCFTQVLFRSPGESPNKRLKSQVFKKSPNPVSDSAQQNKQSPRTARSTKSEALQTR